jgi:hypothetical protein
MPWNHAFGQFGGRTGVASGGMRAHREWMAKRSPLDDPRTSAHAWRRYKRLMRWMFAFTIGVVIVALALVYRQTGMVSIHFFIATALGVGFAVLLMSALMGLVFLSSGTGHDEAISDLDDDDQAGAGRRR